MQEVTMYQLGPILLRAKHDNQTLIVVERDNADPEWFLINTYIFKNNTLKKQDWSEILETELEEWAKKQKNPVYHLIDEVPMFLQVFADDTEAIKEFQTSAQRISQLASPGGYDEVIRLLNEMTRTYRCSERSGDSLADMYLADVPSNLPEDIQDELK